QHREWALRRARNTLTLRPRTPLEPVKMLGSRNPRVVRELVAHVEQDQDRRQQSYRKSGDVDEAVQLVAGESAQRHEEIVPKHWGSTPLFPAQRVHRMGARQA